MNTNKKNESARRLQTLPASVVLVALVWVTGCQTAGYKKGDAAAWNSQVAATSVRAESQELEATIAALNDLVNQPAVDAKPQYLKFEQALHRLVDSSRHAEREVNRIWHQQSAYLAVWDKEIPNIQDPATRSVSETRKKEVSNQFDAASHRYDDAQNNLLPLIAYLQDIRKALSTDLTRGGLVAIKSSVLNANDRASQTQTALAQSAEDLDTLSARTASFRVQEIK